MPNLTKAAADYMNAGLSVMFLTGKQPNTTIHPRGLLSALSGTAETPEDYRRLADMEVGSTGIAIVLPPHIGVVDVDGEEGAAVLAGILGGTDLTPWLTAVASTGRGMHLYYATTRAYRSTKLGEKLDFKGEGGYVAAPPSIHPSGATYKWLVEPFANGILNLEYLPDPIDAILRAKADEAPKAHGPRMEPRLNEAGEWVMVESPASMEGLMSAMRGAKSGDRNNMLNWAAWQAREDGFTYHEVLDAIGGAAMEAGLDRAEVVQTVKSAFRG